MRKTRIILILILFLVILPVMPVSASTTVSVNASWDGVTMADGADTVYPVKIREAGSAHTDTPAEYLYASHSRESSSANLIDYNRRAVIAFNTASTPDDAQIIYANLTVTTTTTGWVSAAGGDPVAAELIDWTPRGGNVLTATSLQNTDYSATNFTPLAQNITNATLSAGDTRYNFTLSSAGLLYINKGGNTTFMLADTNDVYGTNLSLVWNNQKYSGYAFNSITHDAGIWAPQLTYTYITPPASTFTVDYTGGISPLIVNLTNTSTNSPTGFIWYRDTDNGTISEIFNTTQDPQFVSFTTGNWLVKLNASNVDGGTNSSVTWINVTDAPALVLPVPDFSADDTTVTWPTAVQFTDLSESNILGRNWTFGDGTNSTAANPSHVYPNVDATYTVILEVVNISGYNTTTKTDYITVTGLLPPTAAFTKSRPIVKVPGLVYFTDASTNTPTTWEWSFGDGSANVTTQSPSHYYVRPGYYTVGLTSCNVAGCSSSNQLLWATKMHIFA